ncbi:MAG TPA: DUF6062 family protein [Clostridiales bacterium]|nr:DUF6062 family protein [Clostridiales bacterium]
MPKETVDTAVIVRHYEEAPGCPHCSFEQEADAYEIDRLLDGNMMIEDIRMETDARGFCAEHYKKLINARSRFSVAVMLESHLRELQNVYLEKNNPKKGKGSLGVKLNELDRDCYICRRMSGHMEMFEAGVAVLWKRREDFRELFEKKGNLCIHHYARQLAACEKELDNGTYREMSEVMFQNVRKTLDALADETKFYVSRFDYRITGADKNFGTCADVLERVDGFLHGGPLQCKLPKK